MVKIYFVCFLSPQILSLTIQSHVKKLYVHRYHLKNAFLYIYIAFYCFVD